MKKPHIHFIITGGTIDSSYYPPLEKAIPNAQSIVPEYIDRVIQPHFHSTFATLFMKDSGNISTSMRQKILRAVMKAGSDNIVITHGTDTMDQTAALLQRHVKAGFGKKVIITGAMIPLRDIARSDGGFNLGFAAASCLHAKPGVYIAMNGALFPAGRARKNFKRGRFEYI